MSCFKLQESRLQPEAWEHHDTRPPAVVTPSVNVMSHRRLCDSSAGVAKGPAKASVHPVPLPLHSTSRPATGASTFRQTQAPYTTRARKAGLPYSWILAVPLVAVLISLIAVEVMPGCTVDRAYGASGCGYLGGPIEMLASSGFFWLVLNVLIALPLWKALSLAGQQVRRIA